MGYVSVDVFVIDDTPAKLPVAGVTVRVFDESNRQFFTQDVTDDDGRVGFTLWTQNYNLRFFKFGAQIKQPLLMAVVDPTPPSTLIEFEAKATLFTRPVSTDARLCRASGYFRDITGAPDTFVDMAFIGKFDPILLEGSAVVSERRTVRTDAEGWVCIDLIRCARYSVTLQGFEDQERLVDVPDSPSANLPDLLFPVVDQIVFDQDVVAMTVGQIITLTPTVIGSNGVPLPGTATDDLSWRSSDSSLLSVAVSPTQLVLSARAPGTVQLIATRLDLSVIRIPNTPIKGVPVSITIT